MSHEIIDVNKYKNICDAEDRDSVLSDSVDWNLLYHFSKIRENLFEWYNFKNDSDLLEIGAECGALTEYFCKVTKEVVSLEVDEKKAEINKYRNRNNSNSTVLNCSLDEYNEEKKFDYIILVGVLENASKYVNASNSDIKLLKIAKQLMKEDGEIIIVTNNRMGLQYLAGVVDDNFENPFEGFSTNSNLYTKKRLLEVVEGAGLDIKKIYYPMPDYRFMNILFSDEYLPHKGEYSVSPFSYSGNSFKLFDETTTADYLIENGEFENYVNSFFLVVK